MAKIFTLPNPCQREASAGTQGAYEELHDLRNPSPTTEAGDNPAFAVPGGMPGPIGPVTVSPAKFAQIAGVGHNLVRSWCHLADFPVHRDGWRFHINVELGIQWLRKRAAAREGLEDEQPSRFR